MSEEKSIIANEVIERKILFIRNKKVILGSDLAELYGVEHKYLIRQVTRNVDRFPFDFMFRLNKQEVLWCQNVTANISSKSRSLPYVFTEQGVAMLSSVLNSKQAIKVNIQIMRTFTKLREMLAGNKELREKIEKMERKYDQQFQIVFDAIKKLLEPPKEKNKKEFGFRSNKR